MKISYNWLTEFIDLPLSPEETAEKLTLIGLEVEGSERFGSDMEGVVVGTVVKVKEHPNADRLRICEVETGGKSPVQIICGADNVAAGQSVPVATVGAVLPLSDGGTVTIKKAKLRGETSEGMICSPRELALGSDHSGIMVLDTDAAPGTPLREVVEPTQDIVFDIAITPNRPDATGHLGVARDLAAALSLRLGTPWPVEFEEPGSIEGLDIEIENREKCHRYTAKTVSGVTVGESPAWLKTRLTALGVRPVNNVVDVTNYVMLENGQPLHAFDRSLIRGDRIVVRDFDREVTFETLDHVKRKCSPGTLFICDDEQPLAIAGVMGGVDSEVSDSTTDILIESAWFEPGTIRRTAREQNLQTDASYRFERGVDPSLQRIAAERAASLIAEISGGTAGSCSDIHPVPARQEEIPLRTAYVNRLLGTSLGTAEIGELLGGLGLVVLEEGNNSVTWQVPTHRPDLTREVDLVEEVGRLYDYNNIPAPDHIRFTTPEAISEWERFSVKVREIAQGLRFREIYSNSLMPEKDALRVAEENSLIHTLNPISQDMTTLRPSLLPGFLKAAAFNFNRKAEGIRFFETGHIFRGDREGTWYPGICEESHLLMGLGGLKTGEHWKTEPQPYDIFDLKSCLESLLSQAGLEGRYRTGEGDSRRLVYRSGEAELGFLYPVPEELLEEYEIEQPCFAAELSLSAIARVLETTDRRTYEPVSKFPSFEFDFAVTVDRETAAGTMISLIRENAGDSLRDLQVFDVFEGESIGAGNKSIAFRLSFSDKNKTLTINDVEPIINKVLKVLEKKVSAKLRSQSDFR